MRAWKIGGGQLGFHCPGCGNVHAVDAKRWSWDGSLELPTLSPSILHRGDESGAGVRCHSFVKKGRIQFLSDCGHSLAGQTADLPEDD